MTNCLHRRSLRSGKLLPVTREGATKEQIIKIYREEAPTWGASKEQIEIVVDLINDSWDSL